MLTVAALWASASLAWGPPITYSFTSGNRSATADFTLSGTDLIVTLSNTSGADVMVPTDILTAVFFDVIGNPAHSRTSAKVPIGCSVLV